MKSFLGLLFAFSLTTAAVAQGTDWELYSTVDGVEIYTKESDCYAKNIPAQKAVIIKVVNTTNSKVKVEWDQVIWYNDKQVTKHVEEGENHFSVEVEKNDSQEGTCDTPYGPYYIYKDFITYDTDVKLSKFELQNIKITKI
ncbi:MAG: hypothetical protein R2780_13785 [Crocinitomicaceae bacterium]|nr:hypothetical protein [Crocinitomicaceae bacterium]